MRESETHDIQGALKTYENDASDMAIFLRTFAALAAQLRAGKFATLADFQAAMIAVVAKTSKAFQKTVRDDAEAVWASNKASGELTLAGTKLIEAQANVKAAFEAAQKAAKGLDDATKKVELTQQQVEQKSYADAKATLAKADEARAEAELPLDRLTRLKIQDPPRSIVDPLDALDVEGGTPDKPIKDLARQTDHTRALEPALSDLRGKVSLVQHPSLTQAKASVRWRYLTNKVVIAPTPRQSTVGPLGKTGYTHNMRFNKGQVDTLGELILGIDTQQATKNP